MLFCQTVLAWNQKITWAMYSKYEVYFFSQPKNHTIMYILLSASLHIFLLLLLTKFYLEWVVVSASLRVLPFPFAISVIKNEWKYIKLLFGVILQLLILELLYSTSDFPFVCLIFNNTLRVLCYYDKNYYGESSGGCYSNQYINVQKLPNRSIFLST